MGWVGVLMPGAHVAATLFEPGRAPVRLSVFVAVVVLVAGLLAACGDDEQAKPLFEELAPDDGELDLIHVHGLGLNPADGLVYVATHGGLYRLKNGTPELVGERRWDVMGFTVRGANDFIGGGHPSPNEIRDGKYPPLLGFIQTKDAAKSWDILAMRGETDLHALAVGGGMIYAVDATKGQFLASVDGKKWEIRAQLVATSIAVEAKMTVLATTPKGLARSVDDGRSWTLVADAPALVLVATQPGIGPWGIDGKGTVYRNGPAGGWDSVGTVQGRPEAFGATKERLFAATDRGIFESRDGRSWTALYLAPGG